MKKNILIIFALLALSTATFSNRIFAETLSAEKYTPPAKIDLAEVGKKINSVDGSGVRVGEPLFKDLVYNQKDIVSITLPLKNNSNLDYSDISISAYVMVHASGTSAQNYGYKNDLVQVFLSKQASKNVNIQFQMPDSVNITEGTLARIEFMILTKSGALLGLSGKNIKLGKFSDALSVTNAYVSANNRDYTLQQGPTVTKGTSPKLVLEFKNTSLKDVQLIPKIKVYDIVPSKPEVGGKEYESFTIKAGKTSKITLELPVFSKAGVYDGQVHFFDNEGFERAPFISSRWIVDGDIATIPGVNINKNSFRAGDLIVATVSYTGSPVNIDTNLTTDIGTSTMRITLFNEQREVVAEGTKEINLNTLSDSAVFEMLAGKKADSVSAEVVIVKGDVELVRYNTILTDPDSKTKFDFSKYAIIGLLILIVILVFVSVKKKRVRVSVVLLVLIFGFLSLWGGDVVAMTGGKGYTQPHANLVPPTCGATNCKAPIFNLDTWISRDKFSPGENMGYDIYTQGAALVCLNSTFPAKVDYAIYNSDGGLVSSSYAYNIVPNPGGHKDVAYHTFSSFVPATANQTPASINAPTIPGKYILVTNTNVQFIGAADFGTVTYGSSYSCTVPLEKRIKSFDLRTGYIYEDYCPPPGHELPSPMVNYFSFTVVAQTTTPNVVASVPWVSNTQARIKWVYTDPKPQTGNVVEISKTETFDSVLQSISNTPPVVAKSNNFYQASVSMIKSLFGLEVVKAEVNVDDTRSIIVSGLEPDTKYYARIKATNGDNWSAWSYKDFITTVSSVPPDCDPLIDSSCPSTTTSGGGFDATCLVSSSTIKQGESTTFTVAPLNSSGTVTYQWKEFNGPNISGQTATSYTRTYGDTGTFGLQVLATQVSTTGTTAVTKDCSVTVNSLCGAIPSDKCIPPWMSKATACVTQGGVSTWVYASTSVPCQNEPNVTVFKFDPNNTVVGSKCKLFLTATNVSSCYLKNIAGQKSVTETQIPAIGGNISVVGGVGASVGKHTLWCKGVYDGAVAKQYDTEKTCFSDSTFSED